MPPGGDATTRPIQTSFGGAMPNNGLSDRGVASRPATPDGQGHENACPKAAIQARTINVHLQRWRAASPPSTAMSKCRTSSRVPSLVYNATAGSSSAFVSA